ncbi:glycosyltransferase [Vibrio sp. 10N.222.55.E8]
MKQIIHFSHDMKEAELCNKQYSSSSKRFEVEAVYALSKYAKVTVINFKTSNTKVIKISDNLYFMTMASSFDLIKLLFTLKSDSIIVFSGYDLKKMLYAYTYCLIGGRSYSYIYDSHKVAINNKSLIKRVFLDVYFNLGYWLSKKITGWLVLNDLFIKHEALEINYFKTGIGLTNKEVKTAVSISKNKSKVFMYAGTLNDDNGVSVLLDSFRKNNFDAELHIYGDGDLKIKVQDISKKNRNIKYFGRVNSFDLDLAYRKADVLINFRDPLSISNEIAFPSKISEYIEYEKLIISTPLPNMYGDLTGSIITLNSLEQYDVENAITTALISSADVSLLKCIKSKFTWDYFFKKQICFFKR